MEVKIHAIAASLYSEVVLHLECILYQRSTVWKDKHGQCCK